MTIMKTVIMIKVRAYTQLSKFGTLCVAVCVCVCFRMTDNDRLQDLHTCMSEDPAESGLESKMVLNLGLNEHIVLLI